MLKLKQITKQYTTGDSTVQALRGIDLTFRENEFVSILGPSGCGKTTLLNIIGGLDQYTGGDLIINGRSTKDYQAGDWDVYRNRSIGFVFQNYNLIPHQTVLANVELAMTLSGVSRSERRERAIHALERVGLSDQLHKRPNQMSGGQMQRVAIARALVNDPDILLADEPTGALDTETSEQVMQLLKEVASDRLVIMVTHNPDLAGRYSTRIVRLLDGAVVDDTNPCHDEAPLTAGGKKANKKKPMSIRTATNLSFRNLLTKKGRTFLTAFAGSIGIIGIALILSLSNGVQNYINRVEEDTLSAYPITIESETADMSALMETMMGTRGERETHEADRVYSNSVMSDMMLSMMSESVNNNLAAFRDHLQSSEEVPSLVTDIQYNYEVDLNIFSTDTESGIVQVNPSTVFQSVTGSSTVSSMMAMGSAMTGSEINAFTQLLNNEALLNEQYNVIAGRMPSAWNEVVLIVDPHTEVSDMVLYCLNLKPQTELSDMMAAILAGDEVVNEHTSYSFDEILNTTFALLPPTATYVRNEEGIWESRREDDDFMRQAIADAEQLQIVGILRPNPDAVTTASAANTGAIGYTAALTSHYITAINDSAIVREQRDNPETDIFTGVAFATGEEPAEQPEPTMEDVRAYMATLSEEEQAQMQGAISTMGEEAMLRMFAERMAPSTTDNTYDGNLALLGVEELDVPSSISIYAKDFDSKERLVQLIEDYNKRSTEEGREADVLSYTDYIGLMISSVSTVIDVISYVLIAFVSISLVVSSIMIGIITYISVLERTKEIGILRAIGASRKDISRVFNAETLIVGLVSGLFGIGFTMLACLPINAIIRHLTDISGVRAALPPVAAVLLVLISMLLTYIAGLIPSRLAAKKDPVVALRSE